jgi:hypothetical protein
MMSGRREWKKKTCCAIPVGFKGDDDDDLPSRKFRVVLGIKEGNSTPHFLRLPPVISVFLLPKLFGDSVKCVYGYFIYTFRTSEPNQSGSM